MEFASLLMHKQGYRYPPGSLPGNTPVGSLGEHGIDSRSTPIWNPVDTLYCLLGFRQQASLIHTHKPLRGRPKNNGSLMTPAMWIGMIVWVMRQQYPASVEFCDDVGVCLEDMLTLQDRGVGYINTMGADGVVDLQSVLLTYSKIFKAMRRRRVNTAGASVGGYVITQHDRHLDFCEGWLEGQPLQLCTSGSGYLGNAVETKAFGAFLCKCLSHHNSFITML